MKFILHTEFDLFLLHQNKSFVLLLTGSVSPSSLSLSLGLKLRIEASSPAPRSPPAAPPPAHHLEVTMVTGMEKRLL